MPISRTVKKNCVLFSKQSRLPSCRQANRYMFKNDSYLIKVKTQSVTWKPRIGSIISRCLGKEPALLLRSWRSEDRTRESGGNRAYSLNSYGQCQHHFATHIWPFFLEFISWISDNNKSVEPTDWGILEQRDNISFISARTILRWLKIVSSTYIFMGCYSHFYHSMLQSWYQKNAQSLEYTLLSFS